MKATCPDGMRLSRGTCRTKALDSLTTVLVVLVFQMLGAPLINAGLEFEPAAPRRFSLRFARSKREAKERELKSIRATLRVC